MFAFVRGRGKSEEDDANDSEQEQEGEESDKLDADVELLFRTLESAEDLKDLVWKKIGELKLDKSKFLMASGDGAPNAKSAASLLTHESVLLDQLFQGMSLEFPCIVHKGGLALKFGLGISAPKPGTTTSIPPGPTRAVLGLLSKLRALITEFNTPVLNAQFERFCHDEDYSRVVRLSCFACVLHLY